MVTVAVAGGLGHIGHSIVAALKESPKHRVIVLAREVEPDPDAEAPVFKAHYESIEELTKVLVDNDVHTVISAIKVLNEDAGRAEMNLVKAASNAGCTQRFIASDWGFPIPEGAVLPQQTLRDANCAVLRGSGLEWTRFYNGFLLDYYGIPHIKTHMDPCPFVVDMEHKVVALPGTGNDRMTWTYSVDLARFVVASLDLPKWEEVTYCYGDKMTWKEFLSLAEEARGTKFTVTYDDVQMLEQGRVTELPSQKILYQYAPRSLLEPMFAQFELFITRGCFDLPEHKRLNQVFPEIKVTGVKEMLSVWRGR
ncbi:nmrA-like family protein [Cladophialophora carrionii]|uniref:NmrA-like family protein n=1 Tax=Cladophialophora carrionii TaxID=86049 RepID=A0A1C1CLT6_9EURO|nr:nmrA-like family protein [Cladophialophora carrionii]